MRYEKLIRIPTDRIGVLIGKSGNTKRLIEEKCLVNLDVNSQDGEVIIKTKTLTEDIEPFKAVEIVSAIGRGFSPENAMRLRRGDNSLHIIDLREFAGKSPDQIERVKGRIIGEGGTARLNIENLTNALITVYGRTVAIIGEPNQLRLAVDAISSLSTGSMHGPVYSKLESAKRREKAEKAQLWEDQNVY
jgi:ribosomal RNA assembly protein